MRWIKLITFASGSMIVMLSCSHSLAQPERTVDAADPETAIVKAILTKELIRIVEGNISAAEREDGEINKLIRALSGVSVKDIQKYGVCGGSNSEVRKILGSVCGNTN